MKVFGILLLTLVTWNVSAADSATLEAGKTVFMTNCMVCHGEKGNGKGLAAAALDPKPRNFKKGFKEFKFGTTLEAIVTTISNGSPGTAMPPFKDALKPEQLNAVASYVRSLAGAKD